MSQKYSPGDTAYFLEAGQYPHQVKILKYTGGFYTVCYTDRHCIFRTREARLYATKEEALSKIPPKKTRWTYPD